MEFVDGNLLEFAGMRDEYVCLDGNLLEFAGWRVVFREIGDTLDGKGSIIHFQVVGVNKMQRINL